MIYHTRENILLIKFGFWYYMCSSSKFNLNTIILVLQQLFKLFTLHYNAEALRRIILLKKGFIESLKLGYIVHSIFISEITTFFAVVHIFSLEVSTSKKQDHENVLQTHFDERFNTWGGRRAGRGHSPI